MSHPMYIRSEAMHMHWQDNEQYMKTRCTYGTQRGTYYVNGGVINGIVVYDHVHKQRFYENTIDREDA